MGKEPSNDSDSECPTNSVAAEVLAHICNALDAMSVDDVRQLVREIEAERVGGSGLE